MTTKTSDSNPVRVEPVPLRASSPRHGPPGAFYKWLTAGILLGLFILLTAGVWFVFTARRVIIDIHPAPDKVAFSGGLPAVRMGDYYLIRPGTYTLEARRTCYRPLKKQLSVSAEKRQKVSLQLYPLPGHITFDIQPADDSAVDIQGLQVLIDGQRSGLPTGAEATLQPGKRQVEIRSANYQPLKIPVEVEGCNRRQTFRFRLKPDWAQVRLDSAPSGAAVWIDGRQAGQTPLSALLKSGSRSLEIRAPGFQTWRTDLGVVAGKPVELGTVRLRPAAAKVHLSSTPPGANVLVGDRYAGATPLVLSLEPGKVHTIRLTRAGYQKAVRRVELAAGEEKKMRVGLTARQGIVELKVTPTDAQLIIDGQSKGRVVSKIQLPAGPHRLEIHHKEYLAFQTTITVRPGYPRKIKISLQKRSGAGPTDGPGMITATNGYKLKLIPTGAFTMGSSRREQGRLSNETLRQIRLKRPFYMGVREVTNREFKEFKAAHRSGKFSGQGLDGGNLPVVRITWQEAALFCNWLSLKESRDPVYILRGGHLVAQTPLGTGYRLPTEAEWAYSARPGSGAKGFRYPWGKGFPPTSVSGNYADESARRLLTAYITGYKDGYPVTAPVGRFSTGRAGLFDMAGNVAEWCHDVYSIYPYRPDRVETDPTGPAEGRLHVIRGSSWKHGTITTLRIAYRDYGRKPRPDIGFRIARYTR